jgi:hypothetical protein
MERVMGGFVYVMTNKSMPGMVKIGFTTRMPTSRADELFTSGVPSPFVVFSAVWFDEPKLIEAEIHEYFDVCRVTDGREFFRVLPEVATRQIAQALVSQHGGVVVPRWAQVCEDALTDFAAIRGVDCWDVGDVVSEDLRLFVQRNQETETEEGQYHECLSIA